MRNSIGFLKSMFGNTKILGVEIGVFEGEYSKELLKELNIEKLYLIDSYEIYENYPDGAMRELDNNSETVLNEAKEIAKIRLSKFPVEFIYKNSEDAINDIPVVNFVYIDGNHKYEFVKKDIEMYFEKIKPRGVIIGHDFFLPASELEGVSKAVLEFALKNKSELFLIPPEWWIVKK